MNALHFVKEDSRDLLTGESLWRWNRIALIFTDVGLDSLASTMIKHIEEKEAAYLARNYFLCNIVHPRNLNYWQDSSHSKVRETHRHCKFLPRDKFCWRQIYNSYSRSVWYVTRHGSAYIFWENKHVWNTRLLNSKEDWVSKLSYVPNTAWRYKIYSLRERLLYSYHW